MRMVTDFRRWWSTRWWPLRFWEMTLPALSVRLRRDVPLTFPEDLALLEQMAAGLDAAHQAGVIHREEMGTGNRGEREEEGEEACGGGRIVDANDTDLTAFRKPGGKLLMYLGRTDPQLNPKICERVPAVTVDPTGVFFRLFMVPGIFCCASQTGLLCASKQ